ncbi:MAG TPA: UTP--glucose-1-phosphate uridylyltransferase [Thermoleophilaceae bacterium]|nr:UTP--glucose-1-phosphate uridylyltransferase [Thermoleophilaceae bacterium]
MAEEARGLDESVEKMRRAGATRPAIDSFSHYYRLLAEGETGLLPESEIEPARDLQDAEQLPEAGQEGREALDRTVVIKLNGGLGTSMGMTGAKSLIEAKDGLSFLDVIARQVLEDRRRFDVRLPLVLMNSFRTRDESLTALERHPDLPVDVPLDFVQGKVPKLRADDLRPVSWPDDPDLEWAPPGHGDLYTSLVSSGMLAELLGHGYERAFVSNSDNLGAVVDPSIAAWVAREQPPFVMEVADRTESDRKGGHIARRRDGGGLVLRETAQTPDEDTDAFQDIDRHRYFNANSLWIDLRALEQLMRERGNVLGLPMIVNRKSVDPSDSSSPEVIQLESAMGAAIAVFDGAAAIRVPRSRLVPVKTTDDLLALRSDAYELSGDYRLRGRAPVIELDPDHFKLLRDFEQRFPHGPPSLKDCERLTVKGDVCFGRDVTVHGSVTVEQKGEEQQRIEDGAVLEPG